MSIRRWPSGYTACEYRPRAESVSHVKEVHVACVSEGWMRGQDLVCRIDWDETHRTDYALGTYNRRHTL